ncbi:MAG TPA: hypothetical protein VFQ70_03165, partial [Candidatus Saccharimonadaceae bacterium]|nr:hypothetical protein [Candidatus Saccharimonadaceae bacterium]
SSSPKSGCSNTGISFGTDSSFSQNSVDTITLMTGSSATGSNCYWDLTGIGVSQTIPAGQPNGVYSLDLTATVVAQ